MNESVEHNLLHGRWHATRRMVLSAAFLNGASVALGLMLIALLVYALFGAGAASGASVGGVIALIPDTPRARRGKLAHLIVTPLLGLPLFLAVQVLRGAPLELGLLLVPATFLAFLSTAWGRPGMPVAAGLMFAMLLAMAPQPARDLHEALLRTGWCALGSGLYVAWATASNVLLNGRYRVQTLAELLLTVAALLRTHAARITRMPAAGTQPHDVAPGMLAEVLRGQAALAEKMQVARDLILETPDTPRRQQLAGMLIVVLEMRDRLIASELDIERVQASQAASFAQLAGLSRSMARDVEQVADALLLGKVPPRAQDRTATLQALRGQALDEAQEHPDQAEALQQAALMHSVCMRLGDQDGAVRQLAVLARGEQPPDLSAVRNGWQLFVSPAYWSRKPLLGLWRWRQPALRHAVRAALAIGAGYILAQWLPWGSRDYWVLITIVVVLRGSLAQTLERRNQRVLGTLAGSALAVGLLALQPPVAVLLLVVVVAQGVAHAFVARRYVVTALAGSVLGLVLAHLLSGSGSPALDFAERVGDTLLGAALAWGFSYVLPSWERMRIALAVHRVCRAMAAHARQSLALATLAEVTGQPELAWRLARREAYDALSALVLATGRALVEPRAVQPPIALLERLQGHGYQLLGQLSAVQSTLLLRRQRLRLEVIAGPLAAAAQEMERRLDLTQAWSSPDAPLSEGMGHDLAVPAIPEDLPDPFVPDSSPWLLRRLTLAVALAAQVRSDALHVLRESAAARQPGVNPPAPRP